MLRSHLKVHVSSNIVRAMSGLAGLQAKKLAAAAAAELLIIFLSHFIPTSLTRPTRAMNSGALVCGED
jgi:hypothetical protein